MKCTYPPGLFSLIILIAGALSSCSLTSGTRDVEGLLGQLTLGDSLRRDSAQQELNEYLFLKKDLPLIYQALSKSYPDDDKAGHTTRGHLLEILEGVHDGTTPPFIQQLYPNLPENQEMRNQALLTLAHINSPASLEVLTSLLLEHRPKLGSSTDDLFRPLQASPQHLGALYPRLMPMLSVRGYPYPLLETLAIGLEVGAVAPSSLNDSLILIREVYRSQKKLRDHVNPRSQSALVAVTLMEECLRCLAYYPEHPIASQVLDLALEDDDIFVQLSAAKVKIDAEPEGMDSVLNRLAADYRSRNPLYLALLEREKTDIFPAKYLNKEAFAQSDLANWLADPVNRGNYPKEIRLMRSILLPSTEEDEGGFLYLFKYSYGRGWQVGLSGPQPPDSASVITGGYLTLSKYSLVDALDEAGHVLELYGDSLSLELPQDTLVNIDD